jgi:hypothetical protein
MCALLELPILFPFCGDPSLVTLVVICSSNIMTQFFLSFPWPYPDPYPSPLPPSPPTSAAGAMWCV